MFKIESVIEVLFFASTIVAIVYILLRLNTLKPSFRRSLSWTRSGSRNPGKHWMPDQVRYDEISLFNCRVNNNARCLRYQEILVLTRIVNYAILVAHY